MRVPWTARRSNQSILKEISPGCSLEGLMLKLKKKKKKKRNSNTLDTWCEELTHWKRPGCWERFQEEKGMTEDEMAGWHHWLDGHGFGWTPGVGDGQGGLACCSSWGRRVGHDWATELNWWERERNTIAWCPWLGERGQPEIDTQTAQGAIQVAEIRLPLQKSCE